MYESFRFEGFDPGPELQSFAKRTLWQLDAEAPSDSSSEAYIGKTANGYEGALNIVSSSGAFRARVTGATPEKVISHLSDKVRAQLFGWRKHRFQNAVPGIQMQHQRQSSCMARVL